MVMTVKQVLARALSATGQGTVYWAGAGGQDPRAASPTQALAIGREWPGLPAAQQAALKPLAEAAGLDLKDPNLVAPACDCSGYVCWALGIARHFSSPAGDVWLNTDNIWQDACGPARQFRKTALAEVGGLVVYPKQGSGETYGHVGLVTEVGADGHATRIAHCSASNFMEAPHDAIKVNAAEAFQRQPKSIYAWFLAMPR
ncbi:CHAP domain-containing protein [Xylophilus rhododendri]|uniref:CHAP domain-containing protein n=1 Tax=Xylophilus rhododendri TaxID=2697032 RepID=A0A857J9J6_9BURK|nr:CHAP domain-containing protein [Xylophilus rhododendri]QHI99662.1 CHAP domain-containing protein [Xylophilus rhododendri]